MKIREVDLLHILHMPLKTVGYLPLYDKVLGCHLSCVHGEYVFLGKIANQRFPKMFLELFFLFFFSLFNGISAKS